MRHALRFTSALLALACGTCNRGKGADHDTRSKTDPRLLAVVEDLRRRRDARWRDPPPALAHHVAWADQVDEQRSRR